ncbi:MAG: radical SAM protein [Clostridiales bacterium]|nr:radical SAM protein [Clostridiales bacterium]MCF8021087.1 radical SAM protein [Clostridiales bacterium]
MENNYLFGPVPSRRLGISLGVDLVPFKTCTLNCIYCECGKTTNLTVERKEYVPVREVLDQLSAYLNNEPELDYITFSGSGEPTLHSKIGEIISFIKENYPQYNVAVLTNGNLLPLESVRKQLKNADLIVPSLDAASEEAFQAINRPHSSLVCKDIISGLIQFREEFTGEISLEVFIVPGINTTEKELELLKTAIQSVKPDNVQIGTLDRPGTESWVKPASDEEMKKVAARLEHVEVITDFNSRKKVASFSEDMQQEIMTTVKRRPCTVKDLADILNSTVAEINKYLQVLLEENKIECEQQNRGNFFKAKK